MLSVSDEEPLVHASSGTALTRAVPDARKPAPPRRAPATGAGLDYRSIRAADKIREDGEDWRLLGTNADPMVQCYELGSTEELIAQ